MLAAPALRHVLRPEVAAALETPPGPGLLTALEALTGAELSAREWVEVDVAWRRMESSLAGARLTAAGALDRALVPDPASVARRRGSVPTTRAAADELAPALGIAPQAASRLVALARCAEGRLPGAADALGEGRMDLAQFRALAAVTRGMPAAATRRVEALAVRIAPRLTLAQLRARVETEAATADPGLAARQAARGRAEGDVRLTRSPVPGARRVVADLPTLAAIACWQALDACATAAKDRGTRLDGTPEERTLPELRADALTAMATGLLTGPAADGDTQVEGLVPTPERLAQLAEVQVVVAAESLLEQEDLPATVPGHAALSAAETRTLARLTRWRRVVADDITGRLVHYGQTTYPLPVAEATGPPGSPWPPGDPTGEGDARALRADPRWQLLLTDPVPPVRLDHGTERYAPPPPLRRHVHSRDATCIGPACEHTARGTQLDHTVDFARSGPDGTVGTTSDGNLGSECRRVHGAKTFGGWRLEQPTPGTSICTSPAGRTCTRTARPLVPGWQTLRRWATARRTADGADSGTGDSGTGDSGTGDSGTSGSGTGGPAP